MRAWDSRQGGVLPALLLTAVGIVALMVMAGFFVARNVRVRTGNRPDGHDVSIDIPGGHVQVRGHGNLNPASLGIPLYPGAIQRHDSGTASFEWNSEDGRDDKAFAVSGADLVTPDSTEKVLQFYRSRLPMWMVVTERDGSTRIELDSGGYKRVVVIKEKNDGTHIGVATVGEPASN